MRLRLNLAIKKGKIVFRILFITFVLGLLIIGCEDDPVLAPSSEGEGECTGSYCRLFLKPLNNESFLPNMTVKLFGIQEYNPEVI